MAIMFLGLFVVIAIVFIIIFLISILGSKSDNDEKDIPMIQAKYKDKK